MAGNLALVGCSLACVPSFSPSTNECGPFPDFEFLDRSEDCLVGVSLPEGAEGDTACGYPDGPYGVELDSTFPNLELFDCEGDRVQIAQYLPQEALPDVETRGLVLGIGALWCQPCQIEGTEWATGPVDEYQGEIQFIQALDQGNSPSEPMSIEGCAGWSANVANDEFPILWVDTTGGLQAQLQTQPNEPLPYTLIIDANANVRFRQTGGVVDEAVLMAALDEVISNPYGS